ncbi:MAG: hypothetical protein P8Y47_01230, partial [Alphaproteobacteria bacterium]
LQLIAIRQDFRSVCVSHGVNWLAQSKLGLHHCGGREINDGDAEENRPAVNRLTLMAIPIHEGHNNVTK